MYILASTMSQSTMYASYETLDAARFAAVDWIQVQAETYLNGTLAKRYTEARDWWLGQGGAMEIVSAACVLSPTDKGRQAT